MTSKCDELYLVLKNEFKVREFALLKLRERKISFLKICVAMLIFFIAMDLLIESLAFSTHLMALGLLVAVIFGIHITVTKNKINYINNNLHKVLRTYLNKSELLELNKNQFIKFASGDISKSKYLSFIKSELHLISKMIMEDSEMGNINIIMYQKSLEDVFKYLNKALEIEIISLDEYEALKEEWECKVNSIYSDYLETDLEIDLKYLSCINL